MRNTLGNQLEHLVKGLKEHVKVPSPIFGHHSVIGHHTSVDDCSIVGRVGHNFARTIKEFTYMRVTTQSQQEHR